jgi:formate dehydrogenase assembly factor FdhD
MPFGFRRTSISTRSISANPEIPPDTRPIGDRGLLVTGRISAELAFKAARAGMGYVATPSVPSAPALTIAQRAGMIVIGRAVSGTPHVYRPEG